MDIRVRGRPAGTTKDPKRERVKNPNGRMIDKDGVQYNKLIKNGYKLSDDGLKLIKNVSFKPREKVRNPETGRMINVNAYNYSYKPGYVIVQPSIKFRQLEKKYFFDKANNVFITVVYDWKTNADIPLNSRVFKKRIGSGYIYDKLKNILTKPSKKSEKAFENTIAIHDLTIVNEKDPMVQFKMLNQRGNVLILKALHKFNGVMFSIGMDILFSKPDKDNTDLIITQMFHIAVKSVPITHESELTEAVKKQNEEIKSRIDRYTVGGSGWTIEEIQRHYITLSKYKPLTGRTYIPLPEAIQNKKATINIQNNDNKCFMYCLGRALDPNPEKEHLERVSKNLKKVCQDLGLENLKMPVSMKDIPKIETV